MNGESEALMLDEIRHLIEERTRSRFARSWPSENGPAWAASLYGAIPCRLWVDAAGGCVRTYAAIGSATALRSRELERRLLSEVTSFEVAEENVVRGMEALLGATLEWARGQLPPDYVEWFEASSADRLAWDAKPVLAITSPGGGEPPGRGGVKPDLAVVVRVLREVFGSAVVVESVSPARLEVAAKLYETFELSVATDGSRDGRFSCRVFAMCDVLPALVNRPYRTEGAWQPEVFWMELEAIREWCVRVLPGDFLAELEVGLGPLPGVSGGVR